MLTDARAFQQGLHWGSAEARFGTNTAHGNHWRCQFEAALPRTVKHASNASFLSCVRIAGALGLAGQ